MSASTAPSAKATTDELRAWLREQSVLVSETDDHGKLVEMVEETKAELEAEAEAMAEFERATAARESAAVTTAGRGGRSMSVLDEAHAGEEQARREMMAMAAAASPIAAAPGAPVVEGVVVAGDGGGQPMPVTVVAAMPVGEDAEGRRPVGGVPALANMVSSR